MSIIFVAGFFVDLTSGPAWWVIMGAWLGSGVATLHPQAEALVARYVHRLRDLNQMEHERIGQVWYSVCSAAGVDPSAFRVWIYDGERITAPATRGHTIAVTTWSVYTLPAPLLRAVLARTNSRTISAHRRAGQHWWPGTRSRPESPRSPSAA